MSGGGKVKSTGKSTGKKTIRITKLREKKQLNNQAKQLEKKIKKTNKNKILREIDASRKALIKEYCPPTKKDLIENILSNLV